MSNANPVIRTIYLYLFALLGLVLIIIGSVRFLDMALKTFVFKQADEDMRINYMMPSSYITKEVGDKVGTEAKEVSLTQDEVNQINQCVSSYDNWKETRGSVDPIAAQKQRDASISLAMMLVGLPLYLYHWGVIKKDKKA
jgi:hypothetical protein